MRASTLTIGFVLLLAAPAFARVGESVNQVEARYGRPERVLEKDGIRRKLLYRYRGYMVAVQYISGVSSSEFLFRPGTPPLTSSDIKQLLAISAAPGTQWKRLEGGREPFWLRSDGKAGAHFQLGISLHVLRTDFTR